MSFVMIEIEDVGAPINDIGSPPLASWGSCWTLD